MKILVPLATGFEEIEAVTCIDVLRRAGIEVVVAGLDDDLITGSHKIIMVTDDKLNNIVANDLDGIVLPGGQTGSYNLRDNNQVIKLIQELNQKKKLIGAICAAPVVLERAGIIANRNATSYPGFDREMSSCKYQEEDIVIDGNIITSRGPGLAMAFALQLVRYLQGDEAAATLEKGMLVKL